jgi:hypothetical protein
MSLHNISSTIDRALRSAGLDPKSDLMRGIQDTIHKALVAAGVQRHAPNDRPPAGPPHTHSGFTADADVIDIDARVLEPQQQRPSVVADAPAPVRRSRR